MEPNVQCAWCRKFYEFKQGIEGVTHGCCLDCEKKFNEELDRFERDNPNANLKKAFNLSRRISMKKSDNQLINNIVVNLLFINSGRREGDRVELMENLRALRCRGSVNVGEAIMGRIKESLEEAATIWFHLPESSREELLQSCFHDLRTAMEKVEAEKLVSDCS